MRGLEIVETLSARIESVAQRSPGAPAVSCGTQEVTSAELVRKVNLLASRLEEAGVRESDLVAVAIEPSLELIVSLLALNRMGAAYLVLHPEDPETRILALLRANSRLLLFAGDRPPGCGELESLDIRSAFDLSDISWTSSSLAPMPRGDARAAVFPVWDTGGPRLVELDQRRLGWRLQHSPLGAFAGQRVACASPPSTNAAVLHLAALYHGCCLILPERDPSVSPRTFSRTLRSASAEVLVVGPRILQVLAREFARYLKDIAVVVELADPEELQQLRSVLPVPAFDAILRQSPADVEYALVQPSQSDTTAPRLERSTDDGPAPLSFAQQRLWFLDRYEPDAPFYNIVGVLPLRQSLSRATLQRAVDAIIQRHESLRLRFDVADGEPVQCVETEVHVPVPLFDLRTFDPAQRDAEMSRLTEEIAQEAFDLEQAPLIRLRLIQREDDDYVLLLSLHHIVADGWSLEIFSRELQLFYAAFAAGRTVSLPELPIRYTDYARWQRSWFTGDVLNRHLSYWRRMLSGAPPLLRLPESFPRPPVQVFAGGVYNASFGSDLVAPLRDFSRAEGATTFMTLLAAYAALLSRYTGSLDIVVGIPFANRRRPELEGMIGFIANTLVLCFDVSGPVSFRELVGRVRSVVRESYEYQEAPFEKIVEELQPNRDASFNPLFQLAFSHRVTADRDGPRSDTGPPAGAPRTGTSMLDFSLSLLETSHEIQAEVEFRTALYSVELVGSFVSSYQRLLRSILEDPERPVTDFDLLAPVRAAM